MAELRIIKLSCSTPAVNPPVDEVHIRLLHHFQELTRIRRSIFGPNAFSTRSAIFAVSDVRPFGMLESA